MGLETSVINTAVALTRNPAVLGQASSIGNVVNTGTNALSQATKFPVSKVAGVGEILPSLFG